MAINSELLAYSVELLASVPRLEMDPSDLVDLRERFVSVCLRSLAKNTKISREMPGECCYYANVAPKRAQGKRVR